MRKVRLGDLGQIITGNTPSKNHLEFYESSDIPFIKPDDFESLNSISTSLNHKSYISEKARSKARIIPKQSVLVTCIGIIGKVMLTETEVSFNQQINAIIPNNLILAKYLAYQLIFNQNKLNFIANAPVVPIVNKTQFSDFEIQIHDDIKQQKVIVTILENIDSQIIQRRQQLTQFNNLVKSRFYEMFGDPVLNEMDWEVRTLKEICIKLTDGTHSSPKSFSTGKYRYVTAKNIKPSGFDFSNITFVSEEVHRSIYARCNPEQGDVLYIKDGATTGIAMVNTLDEEFTLLSSVALLKQNRNLINGCFLTSVLNHDMMFSNIRRNMGGAAITRLTISKLNNIQIPLPPLALQNQFADFVAEVDKSQLACQKSLDELETLKKSLMQAYFG